MLTLLNDEEWGKWSDREIARRCGVTADMVGDWRRSLSVSDSEKKPTRQRAYTTKHGTEATMRVEKIGRGRRATAPAANYDERREAAIEGASQAALRRLPTRADVPG